MVQHLPNDALTSAACSAASGVVLRFPWDSATGKFRPWTAALQLEPIADEDLLLGAQEHMAVPWDMITGPDGHLYVAVDPAHYVSGIERRKAVLLSACSLRRAADAVLGSAGASGGAQAGAGAEAHTRRGRYVAA